MRGMAMAMVAVMFAAACVHNPDPRAPSPREMESSPFGSWIVVVDQRGGVTSGELISIEPNVIRVQVWTVEIKSRVPDPHKGHRVEHVPARPGDLVAIARRDVREAELYKYDSESFGIAGGIGIAQSVFQLWLTLPLWIIALSATSYAENAHVLIAYPDHPLDDMAMWSRFPAGMPATLDPATLRPIAAPAAPPAASK